MCQGTPVAFVKWMDDLSASASSFTSRLPTPAGIAPFDAHSRLDFESAIDAWYAGNTNTQYLFIVVHGILDAGNQSIGIGDDNDMLTWGELWNVLVTPLVKPPNVIIMGCQSVDAANAWNQQVVHDINMPYLVGYSGIVSKLGQMRLIYKVLHLLAGFLQTMPFTTLDEDVQQLASLTNAVSYHLPVILNNVQPYYGTPQEIQVNHGLKVRDYLDLAAVQWAEQL